MSIQRTEPHDDVNVGVRPRAEVEEAHRALAGVAAGTTQQTQLSRGALTGYLWALGRGEAAPVTGAVSAGAPGLPMLTAEVDAAVAQMKDATQRTVPRDYIHGVHDALAWICGHTEERPTHSAGPAGHPGGRAG